MNLERKILYRYIENHLVGVIFFSLEMKMQLR